MKRLLLLAILLLPVLAKAQDLDHLDKKKGYKTLRLEDTITKIDKQYLSPINDGKSDKSGFSHYHYTDQRALQFSDDIKLKDIILTFYGNNLYSINLWFDKSKGQTMKDIFDRAYGDGYKTNEFMDDYYYIGGITTLEIHFDSTNNNPYASFSSNYLRALNQAKVNQSEKKAVSDL